MNNIWTQVGNTIVGESFDYLGVSVVLSSDGSILAIGAAGVYGSEQVNNFGYVKIFQNINNIWTQIGDNIISEDDNTYFGSSIDLSSNGNIIAIGDPYYSSSITNIGKVKVYQNVNGVWTQIGDNIYGTNQEDKFGRRVSLSSDGIVLAIGAYNPYNSNIDFSYTKVYNNLNGVWTQIGDTINFGPWIDLSSNGNTIAIGGTGNSAGYKKVRVYNNLNGNFTQIGLDFNSEHIWDQFGDSVSLSSDGSILAIGSPWFGSNNSSYGKVSIYKNQSQNWIKKTEIIGTQYNHYCGSSVSLSLSGNTLGVGLPGSLGLFKQTSSGEVKVFDLSSLFSLNTNTFVLENFTIIPNPTSQLININLNNSLEFQKATIYNTLGQIIKNETTKYISVSDLSKGTYFIEVETNKGKATKSFIKE